MPVGVGFGLPAGRDRRPLRADPLENRAGNQPDLHIRQRHARRRMRQIIQQHALAKCGSPRERRQTGETAVVSPDDFHLALLHDAHP